MSLYAVVLATLSNPSGWGFAEYDPQNRPILHSCRECAEGVKDWFQYFAPSLPYYIKMVPYVDATDNTVIAP